MLAREVEEHGALKSRYRALQEESEKNRSEIGLLRSEIQRAGDLVAGREARIEALEAELSAEKDNSVALRSRNGAGTLRRRRRDGKAPGRADRNPRQRIADLGVAGASRRLERPVLDRRIPCQGDADEAWPRARTSPRDCATRSPKASTRPTATRKASARRRPRSRGFRQRADELESSLSSARLEYELAQTLWQQRAELNNDEIEALKARNRRPSLARRRGRRTAR